MIEKYKYTGPTMLIGEHDEYELRSGMKVWAEVNINVATIKGLIRGEYELMLDPSAFDVAAKYLEPVKPDTIHFNPKDDMTRAQDLLDMTLSRTVEDVICGDPGYEAALKELYGDAPQGTYFTPKKIMDCLRNHGKKDRDDSHEVGGDHYKMAIEPWDYIQANGLGFDEGNIVKYASRHKQKNGAEDIRKIISYAKHILKTQYGEADGC